MQNNWRQILKVRSNADFSIEPMQESDLPEIMDMVQSVPQHSPDVVDYIQHQMDLGKSVKAVDSTGKILGFYLLGQNSVLNTLYKGMDVKENIQPYVGKKGLEGVALFVLPEYRGSGSGRALKNYAQNLPYDYMWGYHLKDFNNLQDWLKRRRLIAEDPNVYITLRDKKKT